VLREIDETLEALLRAAVPLGATDVDVSFEAPDREWSAKLNRPTVNLFLWDIRRTIDHARTGMQQFERDGKMMQRLALPRAELRYLVTAWTTNLSDERDLLSGLLRVILSNPTAPVEFQPAVFEELSSPLIRLAHGDTPQIDIFKTLEGQLKPGLDVIVTTEIDLGLERPLATPPSTVDIGLGRIGGEFDSLRRVAGDVLVPNAPGLTVVSPRGSAIVNVASRFLVTAAAGDEISLLSDPVRTVVVPEHGGVVIG
jgi:hypothetical protein